MSPPEPYYSDELVTLHLGKCEKVLPDLPANSVDAIVTDPPAAIAFMGRDWDSNLGGRDRWVAWLAECMEKAARVLKPGGHLLVWSLPRTSGWTQWALEDAGLEIRDCIVHLFGSGFPKSRDVSKDIDRMGGESIAWFGPWLRAERERRQMTAHELCERGGFYKNVNHGGLVVNWESGLGVPSAAQFNKVCEILDLPFQRLEEAEREVIGRWDSPGRGSRSAEQKYGLVNDSGDITAPATESAVRWTGWGTALKPGQEMWWLARKPLSEGTVAANVLEFGTGALNIEACRVASAGPEVNARRDKGTGLGCQSGADAERSAWDGDAGRWPANIVFTHSAACEMTGTRLIRSASERLNPTVRAARVNVAKGAEKERREGARGYGSNGDGTETVEAWDCTPDCPVAELDRQTGGASRFYPTFRYQAKAPASERPRLEDGTAHETVKPLGLMSWLVRLITPPGGTVLDMFAGSGPTGEACIIEGFRCVLIEQNPKSAELIKKRLSKPIQPALFGDVA